MSSNNLVYFLVAAMLSLTACGGGTTTKAPETSATVAGTGPQVSNTAPPPPAPPAPGANETLYVAHVVDSVTGYPIGGVFCSLLKTIPEPDYMRKPRRADVVHEYKTPKHGQYHAVVEADGKDKYLLIAGHGFQPFITEMGPSTPGGKHIKTISATILPMVTFVVRSPNGDRADEGVFTMKPAQSDASIGKRGGSSNVGTTERLDHLGEVTVNRPYGKYYMIVNDSKGHFRYYGIFDWNAEAAKTRKHKIQLPDESMARPDWYK
ncbi:MAG: hypothetical protein CMJ93_08350 [Planctomycetes bacterium]|nr:hypothetical protein [Planctomycetota bacterium]|tara:strand:+ start:205 stop:996 length:792 start_codon:yes stop_codon:yes gene_type:complete